MVMDHLQACAVVICDTRMQIAQPPGKPSSSMMLTVEVLEHNEEQKRCIKKFQPCAGEGERSRGEKNKGE